MIKEIRIQNFGPIREKIVLDFTMHGKIKDTPHTEMHGFKINKINSIFGKNGAGKTASLKAIKQLKSIITQGTIDNTLFNTGDPSIPQVWRNIYEKDENVHIGVTTLDERHLFNYDISFSQKGIMSEEFSYIKKASTKKNKVFNRKDTNLIKNIPVNLSLLRIKFSEENEHSKAIANFIRLWDKINFISNEVSNFTKLFNWSCNVIENLINNDKIKGIKNLKDYQEKILSKFLCHAELNFDNYKIIKENRQAGNQIISNYLIVPISNKKRVQDNINTNLTLSHGTIEFIMLLTSILATGHFGGVVLIDEFASHTHPELSLTLLNIFKNWKDNKSQLIFNTNQASLIENMQSEQMNFLDNLSGLGTSVWKPQKKDTNNRSLYKAFIEGRVAGSPNVDHDNVANIFKALNDG